MAVDIIKIQKPKKLTSYFLDAIITIKNIKINFNFKKEHKAINDIETLKYSTYCSNCENIRAVIKVF